MNVMTVSKEAQEMIQRAAQKTGVSEESLIIIYWCGYCDGILDLSKRQLASLEEAIHKRAA